jgi:hypothetical protein
MCALKQAITQVVFATLAFKNLSQLTISLLSSDYVKSSNIPRQEFQGSDFPPNTK